MRVMRSQVYFEPRAGHFVETDRHPKYDNNFLAVNYGQAHAEDVAQTIGVRRRAGPSPLLAC